MEFSLLYREKLSDIAARKNVDQYALRFEPGTLILEVSKKITQFVAYRQNIHRVWAKRSNRPKSRATVFLRLSLSETICLAIVW